MCAATTFFSALSFFSLTATAVAAVIPREDVFTAGITPHDSYSSSIGVVGCKIDTNRVAYWPFEIDCENICVEVSYEGRSVHLLRIDSSQGAYDISYDAYNYLITSKSALEDPQAGGAVTMTWRNADPEDCKDLIHTPGNKLPISASNSMNFMASCLQKNSEKKNWVANNYVFYNILDSICSLGVDEECSLDWPAANTPTCPHTLGNPVVLEDHPVYNIRYPTGEVVNAATNTGVSGAVLAAEEANGTDSPVAGGVFAEKHPGILVVMGTLLLSILRAQTG